VKIGVAVRVAFRVRVMVRVNGASELMVPFPSRSNRLKI